MSFAKVLGSGEVCRQLEALSDSRRLPHAVVFESRDFELARNASVELAAAYLCESEGRRPCGICRCCRKIYAGIHPDVKSVETTGGKQATGVGEIRNMISDCYIKPNEASGKVYMIFDKMTAEAQNALLKILEEPPQNVRFIITTEKSTLLLKTVLSRSVLFKLGEDNDVVRSEEALMMAIDIARAIPESVELPLLAATSGLTKSRELTEQTLNILGEFFTQALEEKYLGERGYKDYITGISRMLKRSSIVSLLDVVKQAQEMLAHNCNMNVLATWFCANIRESRH